MPDYADCPVTTVIVNLDPTWSFRTRCYESALDLHPMRRGVELIDLAPKPSGEKLEEFLDPWPRCDMTPRECVAYLRQKIDALKAAQTDRIAMIFCLGWNDLLGIEEHGSAMNLAADAEISKEAAEFFEGIGNLKHKRQLSSRVWFTFFSAYPAFNVPGSVGLNFLKKLPQLEAANCFLAEVHNNDESVRFGFLRTVVDIVRAAPHGVNSFDMLDAWIVIRTSINSPHHGPGGGTLILKHLEFDKTVSNGLRAGMFDTFSQWSIKDIGTNKPPTPPDEALAPVLKELDRIFSGIVNGDPPTQEIGSGEAESAVEKSLRDLRQIKNDNGLSLESWSRKFRSALGPYLEKRLRPARSDLALRIKQAAEVEPLIHAVKMSPGTTPEWKKSATDFKCDLERKQIELLAVVKSARNIAGGLCVSESGTVQSQERKSSRQLQHLQKIPEFAEFNSAVANFNNRRNERLAWRHAANLALIIALVPISVGIFAGALGDPMIVGLPNAPMEIAQYRKNLEALATWIIPIAAIGIASCFAAAWIGVRRVGRAYECLEKSAYTIRNRIGRIPGAVISFQMAAFGAGLYGLIIDSVDSVIGMEFKQMDFQHLITKRPPDIVVDTQIAEQFGKAFFRKDLPMPWNSARLRYAIDSATPSKPKQSGRLELINNVLNTSGKPVSATFTCGTSRVELEIAMDSR